MRRGKEDDEIISGKGMSPDEIVQIVLRSKL